MKIIIGFFAIIGAIAIIAACSDSSTNNTPAKQPNITGRWTGETSAILATIKLDLNLKDTDGAISGSGIATITTAGGSNDYNVLITGSRTNYNVTMTAHDSTGALAQDISCTGTLANNELTMDITANYSGINIQMLLTKQGVTF